MHHTHTLFPLSTEKDESFYVGDAAGRVYGKDKPPDFAGTDRKWADNVGLTFYTPEVSRL